MLYDKVRDMNEEIETLTKLALKEALSENIDTMDQKEFKMLKHFRALMHHMQDYLKEEAAAIDSINLKLDRLLELSKEKES